MSAGEQHGWEPSPDTVSQSNSSHCQSAGSSGRGKIASPGKFLSGHFMQKKKKKGGWEGRQGDPGYSRASGVFLLKPCQEQEKVLWFVPMHRSESVLRLGFPSQNVRKFLKKKTYTHAELARPFFLGTGSQTVIWVRFPLGIRAGWLSHPRLLANGNRKFIMTRLLIKFASSFCCSHRRLGQLVVSRFANNTQNVPAQQIYTNRAYFLLFYKQPGLLINRNWRTLWN